MTDNEIFKAQLVALLPKLRGHAMALTGSTAAADDLIQETMLRAWRFRETFAHGTNMAGWLNRILRNTFHTVSAAQRHTVQDVDGKYAAQLSCEPDQEWRLRYGALLKALRVLSPETREALLLVIAEGLSYEEAAAIVGCPAGTIKSRVSRARVHLAEILDLGPFGAWRAGGKSPRPANSAHPATRAA